MLAAVIVPAVCTRPAPAALQHCSILQRGTRQIKWQGASPAQPTLNNVPPTEQSEVSRKKLEIKSKRTNLPRILYRL